MKGNNFLPPSAPEESRPENREDQALIPQKTDWLRIGQLTFSSLAALILLVFFFISILVTVIRDSITSPGLEIGSDLSSCLFRAGLGGMGLLMIPSAVNGFAAVQDRLGPKGSALADFAPVGLIILALGSFFGLLKANKFFRRAIMAGSN